MHNPRKRLWEWFEFKAFTVAQKISRVGSRHSLWLKALRLPGMLGSWDGNGVLFSSVRVCC